MKKSDDPFKAVVVEKPEPEPKTAQDLSAATQADYAWAMLNAKRLDDPESPAPSRMAEAIAGMMGEKNFDLFVAKCATSTEQKQAGKKVDSNQIRLSGIADALLLEFDKSIRSQIQELLRKACPDVAAA